MGHAFQTAEKSPSRSPVRTSSQGSMIMRQVAPATEEFLQPKANRCACGGSCPRCQAKSNLRIGAPEDPYEREADAVADRVMRMADEGASPIIPAASALQRKCDTCEKENEESLLQPKGAPSLASARADDAIAPASVHEVEVLNSHGQPLSPETRTFFEPRFAHDFGQVRVHTDATAAASAEAVRALAYTVGHDIVFAPGRYAPSEESGRRLIAHELVHVLQQSASRGRSVQRQGDKDKPKTKPKTPPAPTAADAPKIVLTSTPNPPACACLVLIHNNERNAKKTGRLMHQHCAYNLALVWPDNRRRAANIKLSAKRAVSIDANELFPRDVVEQCAADAKGCEDFLKDKSGTTDPDEILKFVHINFFLKIAECSKGFSLPVIALHNNSIDDTATFLKKQKDKEIDPTDLRRDFTRKNVHELEELLKSKLKKFKKKIKEKEKVKGKDVEVERTEGESIERRLKQSGKTNIFLWCLSPEIARCHIGDTDNPDRVIWVTNDADYATLEKEPVNVVLQADVSAASAKGSKSSKDLSTVFKVLENMVNAMLLEDLLLYYVWPYDEENEAEIEELEGHLKRLRFVNIETPGEAWGAQSASERVASYGYIVQVLKAVGLHCCGKDTATAEESVKKGLEAEAEPA